MWTWFLLVIINCIMVIHNACLHIDSLSFDDVIILLTVFEMLCLVF